MLIRKAPDIRPSEITDKSVYLSRRRFIRSSVGTVLTASALGGAALLRTPPVRAGTPLIGKISKSPYSTDETKTPYEDITTYNNFYEFGTGKGDPSRYAGGFHPRPWSVTVAGECNRPGTYDLEDFLKPRHLEERIYRLRCVEAWSMVIPWVGIPLAAVLKRFEPNSHARYLAMTTVYRPSEMPGQRRRLLDWPYVEGLRLDEAMHPLTILAVGLYGEVLPNQDGAPLRLVVPWKYGFKSIKSIVKFEFTRTQPPTAWNKTAPGEYGFYANVNPRVDHPRWSQAKERRIGDFFKRKTLMFNGYGEQVASLYQGMDLRKHF